MACDFCFCQYTVIMYIYICLHQFLRLFLCILWKQFEYSLFFRNFRPQRARDTVIYSPPSVHFISARVNLFVAGIVLDAAVWAALIFSPVARHRWWYRHFMRRMLRPAINEANGDLLMYILCMQEQFQAILATPHCQGICNIIQHIDGVVQDCRISIAKALEILQSSIYAKSDVLCLVGLNHQYYGIIMVYLPIFSMLFHSHWDNLKPQSYYHVLVAAWYLHYWHPHFEEIGVDFGWLLVVSWCTTPLPCYSHAGATLLSSSDMHDKWHWQV